jgi:hypothetical protein
MTEIYFPQDPLSALDAHVGEAVFRNVLQNSLSGKTRVLVTHALHFLPEVDYIYVVVDGRIVEQGSYADIVASGKDFARFIAEFGAKQEHKEKEENSELVDDEATNIQGVKSEIDKGRSDGVSGATQNATTVPGLMQDEERITGAVSWNVYRAYALAGHGGLMMPVLFLSLGLMEGATVMSSYWLVWWQEGCVDPPPHHGNLATYLLRQRLEPDTGVLRQLNLDYALTSI